MNFIRYIRERNFRSDAAIRLNARRMEEFCRYEKDLRDKSILEVGSGIGLLSTWFIDRRFDVTLSDARVSHVKLLQKRFPDTPVILYDLRDCPTIEFDVVFCFGVLYHLENPVQGVRHLDRLTKKILFLETLVAEKGEVNPTKENKYALDQSLNGLGCRPGWDFLYRLLFNTFPIIHCHDYPHHEDYRERRRIMIRVEKQ